MASFFFDKARQSWTCQYKEPDSGKFKAQRFDEKGDPFKRKKDANIHCSYTCTTNAL